MVAIAIPPIPKIDFIPMKDYVLLKELAPDETPNGVVLPEGAELGLPRGLVLAVGEGRPCDYDPTKKYPMDCRKGDIVFFCGSGVRAVEMIIDGKPYLQVRDRDITAWQRKTH